MKKCCFFHKDLTHLCLASHKRDTGEQYRPMQNALFALITGFFFIKNMAMMKTNKIFPLLEILTIKVEESTWHKWVNYNSSNT